MLRPLLWWTVRKLSSDSVHVRKQATEKLGASGDRRALLPLIEALQREKVTQIRAALGHAIEQVYGPDTIAETARQVLAMSFDPWTSPNSTVAMQLFYEMFISMGRQLDLIQKAQYTLCRVCNIFLYDRPMFHQPVPHLFEGNYTSDIIKSVFEKNDPSLDAILADARDPGVVPYLAKCFLDNPPIADVGRTSGYMKIVQRNLCIIRLLREIGTRDAAKALDTFCNETTYAFGSVFPTMAAKMLKELPVR